MNFLNSDWFRRFIASSDSTTCPQRNFAREVNKCHVAVSTYPNIVTLYKYINLIGRHFEPQPIRGGLANELR